MSDESFLMTEMLRPLCVSWSDSSGGAKMTLIGAKR